MQVEFLVNGDVSIVMAPENEMEEQLLKNLLKNPVDITEFRTTVTVLNKTFRSGIVIGKDSSEKAILETNQEEKSDDQT